MNTYSFSKNKFKCPRCSKADYSIQNQGGSKPTFLHCKSCGYNATEVSWKKQQEDLSKEVVANGPSGIGSDTKPASDQPSTENNPFIINQKSLSKKPKKRPEKAFGKEDPEEIRRVSMQNPFYKESKIDNIKIIRLGTDKHPATPKSLIAQKQLSIISEKTSNPFYKKSFYGDKSFDLNTDPYSIVSGYINGAFDDFDELVDALKSQGVEGKELEKFVNDALDGKKENEANKESEEDNFHDEGWTEDRHLDERWENRADQDFGHSLFGSKNPFYKKSNIEDKVLKDAIAKDAISVWKDPKNKLRFFKEDRGPDGMQFTENGGETWSFSQRTEDEIEKMGMVKLIDGSEEDNKYWDEGEKMGFDNEEEWDSMSDSFASKNPFYKKSENENEKTYLAVEKSSGKVLLDVKSSSKEKAKESFESNPNLKKTEWFIKEQNSSNPFYKEAREFGDRSNYGKIMKEISDKNMVYPEQNDFINKKTKNKDSKEKSKKSDAPKATPNVDEGETSNLDSTWSYNTVDRKEYRSSPKPQDYIPGYKEWYDQEVDPYYDGWLDDHIENSGGSIPGSNTEKTMNLNAGEREHSPTFPAEAVYEKLLESRHNFDGDYTRIVAEGKSYLFKKSDVENILKTSFTHYQYLRDDPEFEAYFSEKLKEARKNRSFMGDADAAVMHRFEEHCLDEFGQNKENDKELKSSSCKKKTLTKKSMSGLHTILM